MNAESTTLSPSISWPRELSIVFGAALFLAIASQISIPLQPVPLTFQSITVLLIGMALGPRLGGYAIALYLVAGSLGLPVFADFHAGFATFMGPTGGYLIGFLPAAVISGYLTQQHWKVTGALLGTFIIFGLGFAFLAQYLGTAQAWALGVKPFLISEPIKLMILCLFVK
ncbi:MAG TPA: biotin transporter BioY [Gammaproteobacteria bacterium]|nr:biotin transporter BioY [Gammaproteobacteria bacterium]